MTAPGSRLSRVDAGGVAAGGVKAFWAAQYDRNVV